MDVSIINEQFKGLSLPPKDSDKPSAASKSCTVVANLFEAVVPMGQTIYKYRVDFKKIRQEKEYDLTKGIRSDVAIQHRRRVCRSLFEDALKKAEKDGSSWTDDKYTMIYDCGNIIYSAKPLKCFDSAASSGDKIVGITLQPTEDISSEFSRRFVGEKAVVVVSIEPTLEFETSLKETGEHQETQQFLNVLTSSQLYKDGDHFAFGNKFYGKTSRNDVTIREAKCIKPGFEKNIRVGERNGQPMALIQLDAKKSPFFVGLNMVDFFKEILSMRSKCDLESLDNHAVRKLSSQAKGLAVKTLHTPKDKARYFHVAGISKERVKDITFEVGGQQTTMVDFFKQKYNYALKYTRLPCVIEKTAQKMFLYPMEVLEIERGQRVTSQKASNAMGEKQIQHCRMAPAELKAYIEDMLAECKLDPRSNKYLDAFKVKVGTKLEYVAGRVLYPPAIVYDKSSVEPTRDGQLQWKLTREQFLKPATIDKILFIIFDDCIKEDLAGHFMDKVLRTGYGHGMTVPSSKDVRISRMRSEETGRLEETFQMMKPPSVAVKHYIWCVTKQKMDPVHDTMKMFEAKYGVLTQHVSQQVLFKATGNQGAFLVINNLVMKMNPKAGGVNHMVALPRAFSDANKGDKQVSAHVFAKNRMVFGFDVSHPGPQSFAERALGVRQSEPSVVGMSYSMSCPTEVRGMYWMQEPRFTGISGITKYVAEALLHRLEVCRSLPDDIVVYRGGVSEGEYDKVIMEIESLKAAFSRVGRVNYSPSLTCIVVLTNSSFRLFPERIDTRAKAWEQNVQPGTIVDCEITSPYYNEFLLVAQKGILGTVRPTRCVIVATAEGTTGQVLKSNDAQLLTYSLAYGHQIVTESTTQPLPLTAAMALSKRGKNVWKEVNFTDSDARSALSGGTDGCLKHDGSDDYFQKLSATMENKTRTHYWA